MQKFKIALIGEGGELDSLTFDVRPDQDADAVIRNALIGKAEEWTLAHGDSITVTQLDQ